MKTKPPRIDERTFSNLLEELQGMIPHYTPEWKGGDEKDPGVALLKIFAHMTEGVIHRFNQVPHKNFVAFLDMLGIKLIPAQPSRVPLTFTLAKGTEKEILIPAGTQAATDKTDKHEKMPFETEKNLMAVPSQLMKVISVDPLQTSIHEGDAIYLPPPGFLDEKPAGKVPSTYKIVSSPSAGDTDFQMDHAADLEEGDHLKVGDAEKTEFVIISSIKTTIISITDTLMHSFQPGTPVEKVTKFNLFEGKNIQEHSLFIGHKDLFNVKSTAQFNLEVRHREGTETGIDPLKVSWEYWGEMEGEEGESWRKFNAVDATAGLSKSGMIILDKNIKGEIKEKEINNTKSRWIRCILEEPLPVNVVRTLPEIDTITTKLSSSETNLLPDLAFNNDIPLDITKTYHPLGKEPRIFDNFFLASKEAFSKKKGKITLDIEVEPRGVLGAPTAIRYYNKLMVFARGTYGRLIGVEISEYEEPFVRDHGFPLETTIALETAPSAVTNNIGQTPSDNDYISVFANTENGHLVERYFYANQWKWLDHGVPDNIPLRFDPSAIVNRETNLKTISVFVAGSNGSLYEFTRNPENLVGEWIDHGKPDGTDIDSSPYAVEYYVDQEM